MSADRKRAAVVKTAVALRYEAGADAAPRVVASGRGKVAEKMLDTAQANAVPVREDPLLAKALGQIELGHQIPPELYRAVAEVLAFVYRLDRGTRK